jgi:tRNA nucleotidyltransferase (CCA-adding enzyme)
MAIRIFEVGGAVRDRFLGKENKDRDFAVEAPSWEAMRAHVHAIASKVFLETPEHFTIRALVPVGTDAKGKARSEARDFVLCRKDGAYSDGRHPDTVEVGTIFDDLARRDFTVNAMAVDVDTGELLDPHGGRTDCEKSLLRCVGRAEDRFGEDSLRILRAIRFSITKGLSLDREIVEILEARTSFWPDKLKAVSIERIREELLKCFQHDTLLTLRAFQQINWMFAEVIFGGGDLWLEPTLAARPKRTADLTKAMAAVEAFKQA